MQRKSSCAAAAGEPLNSEKPKCRRGQVQRLVQLCFGYSSTRGRRWITNSESENDTL